MQYVYTLRYDDGGLFGIFSTGPKAVAALPEAFRAQGLEPQIPAKMHAKHAKLALRRGATGIVMRSSDPACNVATRHKVLLIDRWVLRK